jgi:tRNA (guanine-N7-)-methyltransferase
MARGRHPTRIHIAPPDDRMEAKYLFRWEGRYLFHEPHRYPGLTSPEIFGNDKPLEIDIGCGQGVLTCSRARQYPDRNFIGIDKSHKPIFCAVHDAAATGLDNIKFIRSDFLAMLGLFRPQTVRTAYYLFPNPPQDYHQERANGRRRAFLQNIHDALLPGGRLYFATDAPAFFACMNDIIEKDLCFTILGNESADAIMTTHYRQLWEREGRPYQGLVVEKR